ncbi:MAG TPA: hypothetical protein VFA00_08545 [Actinomycetota bacterium]|jgi:sugar lactone lactonase YvrE|nr:hypothetical protein [Actinomycetota bacterium]
MVWDRSGRTRSFSSGSDCCFVAGLAVDEEGNLYMADGDNHRIRKVDEDGVITTVARG